MAQFEAQELETARCPMCDDSEHNQLYTFAPFAVVRCRTCHFSFLSPRLTESRMLKFYAGAEYFSGGTSGYDSYEEQEKALRATFARVLKVIAARGLSGGSILDVGCGYGYFLDEARGLFSSRTGTDFSEKAVAQAGSRADSVYQGGIDAIPADARFDFISAIQVIEHIYQPHQFMQALTSRLKPGGKLLLATPHIGSFWHFFLRRRWPSFKLPEHVLYFDRESLPNLMAKHGLTRIQEVPYPHAFPLTLFAAKFGIKLPSALASINAWFPETTIAFIGEASGERNSSSRKS